jgi:hypothetical protein
MHREMFLVVSSTDQVQVLQADLLEDLHPAFFSCEAILFHSQLGYM